MSRKPKRIKRTNTVNVRSGSSGSKVRRKDKNDNTYFIDRKTGKRVSEKEWKLERKKIKLERDHYRAEREKDLDKIKQPPKNHFPEYVSEVGYPEKPRDNGKKISDFNEFDSSNFEGESFEVEDFEPFAIEGEDDTG